MTPQAPAQRPRFPRPWPVALALACAVLPAAAPPVLVSLTPAQGPAGTEIALLGSGFTGATRVTFGGVPALGAPTVLSDFRLTARVPSGARPGPVAVTTPGGTGRSSGGFTLQAAGDLAIQAVEPPAASAGTTVWLLGAGLAGVTGVTFGGVAADFTVVWDGRVNATVPAGLAPGDTPVAVTTGQGLFRFAPWTLLPAAAAPVITGFQPRSGPAGTRVVLSGTGLAAVTAASLGGVAVFFHVWDDTRMVLWVPEAGAVSGNVRLSTASGAASHADAFLVTSDAGEPWPALTD